jgi:hypothetical protein
MNLLVLLVVILVLVLPPRTALAIAGRPSVES